MKTTILFRSYQTELYIGPDGLFRISQGDADDVVILTRSQTIHLRDFITDNLELLSDFDFEIEED